VFPVNNSGGSPLRTRITGKNPSCQIKNDGPRPPPCELNPSISDALLVNAYSWRKNYLTRRREERDGKPRMILFHAFGSWRFDRLRGKTLSRRSTTLPANSLCPAQFQEFGYFPYSRLFGHAQGRLTVVRPCVDVRAPVHEKGDRFKAPAVHRSHERC
jgi:hypothetical protein